MAIIPIIKRQKRTIGSVVMIPLEEGYHTYARILKNDFAFYDYRTKEDISDIKQITDSPILFITAVYDYAVTKGYWLKIDSAPLEEHLGKLPPQFIQDPLRPTDFYIVENGKRRLSSLEEIRGLERVAVWTPEAIQTRINDHYAGRKNYSVESMRNPELSHEEIKQRVSLQYS